MNASLLSQVQPLAKRAIARTFRQPAVIVGGLVMPLFLYFFNLGGLDKAASRLQDFPTDSYETFGLALTFVFCGIFAVTVAGTQLGEDLRTGFVRRLTMTPMRGSALLLGQLAGVAVFAVVQAVIFLAVGLAVGAHVEAGPGGAVLLVLLAALYAMALGTVGVMAAQATGSGEAVQGLFPVLTISIFVSSASLPREYLTTDWFQTVATFNPISYMVEAPRSLLIEGWDAQALGYGAGVAFAILFAALLNTALTLRTASVRR